MAFEAPSLVVTPPDELGRVTIEWNGHKLLIHCSHRNMIVMQAAWGRADFLNTAIAALNVLDLDNLASMYSMCAYLDGSDKRIDREEFLELCIPLEAAISAMNSSWQVAWNGYETPEPEEEDPEKKRNPLQMLFRRFLTTR